MLPVSPAGARPDRQARTSLPLTGPHARPPSSRGGAEAMAPFETATGAKNAYDTTGRVFAVAMSSLLADDNEKGKKKPARDDLAGWTHDFSAEKGDLTYTGKNRYMILEPGLQLILEGGK